MAGFRNFLKSGHAPTLGASFFYFMFSCAIWVINGTMAPFISESFQLSPAQKGLMLSVPIFAGALMRFPLGVLAQYIGRKNATLVEMGGICLAMLYGYFMVESFNDLLAMGVLLGIAGASFGVALSLGSGSFPPRYKGLAMGLVGAGNVGTAVSALLAPPLAQAFGWQAVYGFAAIGILIPMVVMIVFAKEPDDIDTHASFKDHVACLFEKDGWAFSLIYAVTFGGFIGLASFLPSYFFDQFHVSKVEAGQLTMLAAFMGAAVRIFGGTVADLRAFFEDEDVFAKNSFTAYTEDVKNKIETLGPKKIIVTGMETHVCVYQTVRDLLDAGYEVHIAKDCVGSRTKENYQNGLDLMENMGAIINNTETIVFDLLKVSGTKEFKIMSALIK